MNNKPLIATLIVTATIIIVSVILFSPSQTPVEKLDEAMALMQQGESSRSVLKLVDITKNHGDDPAAVEANLILAQYYASIGNGDKAVDYLDTVIESEEFGSLGHKTALEGKLALISQMGDLEKAEGIIENTIAKADDLGDNQLKLEKQIQLSIIRLSWPENEEKSAAGKELMTSLMIDSEEASTRGIARERFANYYRSRGNFEESNKVYLDYLAAYPDDPISSQLKFAIAANSWQMGEEIKAIELAKEAEGEILAEIQMKEDKSEIAQLYRVLAVNHRILNDLDKAEEYFREAMGAVPMSVQAIKTQFEIAEMFISEGIQADNNDYFKRGIDVLDQIKTENPGTNIALSADDEISQATQALDRMRVMRAQYEEQLAEQQRQMEAMAAETDGMTTEILVIEE